MNYILHIDCCTEEAYVSLSNSGMVVLKEFSNNQKEHASFLHPSIERLMSRAGISLADLSAIAVVNGPGSYTGLRVGLSTAKGLCFALSLPLITISSLEVLAHAAIEQCQEEDALYVPMIDARRMEVFTATYSSHLEIVDAPKALILSADSFGDYYSEKRLFICGSGMVKAFPIITHNNIHMLENLMLIESMATLSNQRFIENQYSDLSLTEPMYIKAFNNDIQKMA